MTLTMPNTLSEHIHQLTQAEVVALPGVGEAWSDMLDRITILGRVSEVDRETYWHFLEVLPPRWMGRGDFCFAEGAEPFWFFWEKGGRYFCRRLTWEQTRTFCDLAGIRRDYYYF